MITVEGSFDSSRTLLESFEVVSGLFSKSSPIEKIPDAHVIALEDNFALILRPNSSKSTGIESFTALLIKQLHKPDSECMASFTISEDQFLNLVLPAENIVLNDSNLRPFTAVAFEEKCHPELASIFSDWIEQVILANRYIYPPTIFVSE